MTKPSKEAMEAAKEIITSPPANTNFPAVWEQAYAKRIDQAADLRYKRLREAAQSIPFVSVGNIQAVASAVEELRDALKEVQGG